MAQQARDRMRERITDDELAGFWNVLDKLDGNIGSIILQLDPNREDSE